MCEEKTAVAGAAEVMVLILAPVSPGSKFKIGLLLSKIINTLFKHLYLYGMGKNTFFGQLTIHFI